MAKQAQMIKCPKCDGNGYIGEYAMIQNGVCFKCSGTGQVRKPKQMSAAAKAKKQAKAQAKAEYHARCAAESDRKAKIAMEMYKDDPRLRVAVTSPYFKVHAIELAQYYGTWGTL